MQTKRLDKKRSDKESVLAQKKPEVAVALSYDGQTMDIPEVSAIGFRNMAKEIQKVARRYGVPVHYSKPLAHKLGAMADDEAITPDLYEEVARVFAEVESKKK